MPEAASLYYMLYLNTRNCLALLQSSCNKTLSVGSSHPSRKEGNVWIIFILGVVPLVIRAYCSALLRLTLSSDQVTMGTEKPRGIKSSNSGLLHAKCEQWPFDFSLVESSSRHSSLTILAAGRGRNPES